MKPILFSTPMVETILAGRKTMTRRVIKPQPTVIVPDKKNRTPIAFWTDNERWIKPPYQPGDILWVRETWNKNGNAYLYKAGCPHLQDNMWLKWRPSIFMPREAARIFLRVTEVRVERLQEIAPEDAVSEGAVKKPHYMKYGGVNCLAIHSRYVDEFAKLWDNISAKSGYGWDANPWVWVISFERCEPAK